VNAEVCWMSTVVFSTSIYQNGLYTGEMLTTL
jgi:hypothetical protein